MGENIIENIDFTKYKIGGEETGSFLIVSSVANGDELPAQGFIVNAKPGLFIFLYQDSKAHFDSQVSKDTMNRIIKSIKFLA